MVAELFTIFLYAAVVVLLVLPFIVWTARKEMEVYREIEELLTDKHTQKIRRDFIERIKNADTDREMDERE